MYVFEKRLVFFNKDRNCYVRVTIGVWSNFDMYLMYPAYFGLKSVAPVHAVLCRVWLTCFTFR